ncbi:MAG: hypothetical protein ACI90E_001246, partial [Yoonia sp.]
DFTGASRRSFAVRDHCAAVFASAPSTDGSDVIQVN